MHMISLTEEYALRAMACLAFKYPQYLTRNQLTESTQVPHAYLPKIMLELNRTGFIHAQRGHNGGYRLLQDPSQTSLFDIIQAVRTAPPRETDERSNSLPPEIRQLHQRLNHSFSRLETDLSQTSLADLFPTSDTHH